MPRREAGWFFWHTSQAMPVYADTTNTMNRADCLWHQWGATVLRTAFHRIGSAAGHHSPKLLRTWVAMAAISVVRELGGLWWHHAEFRRAS